MTSNLKYILYYGPLMETQERRRAMYGLTSLMAARDRFNDDARLKAECAAELARAGAAKASSDARAAARRAQDRADQCRAAMDRLELRVFGRVLL